APTIRAILYFGTYMRVALLLISVAQAAQAARGFQHRIKRGLVCNGGIFGAQHAERTRMIFLRLLGPELVSDRDAEFFPLLGKRLFVGACPGHELLPDLRRENWHQGWRQRWPGFERSFSLRPEHAMYPVPHIR